jgi:hypothetical protein
MYWNNSCVCAVTQLGFGIPAGADCWHLNIKNAGWGILSFIIICNPFSIFGAIVANLYLRQNKSESVNLLMVDLSLEYV